MQTFGELKHLITKFNEMVFGGGYYFYWEKDHKKAMQYQDAEKNQGDLLVLHVMFDPSFKHEYEVYIKHCTGHNLPPEFYIPDHWTKPPFEIDSLKLVGDQENEEEKFVKEFTLKLNHRTSDAPDYFWITASRFHFEKKQYLK